MADHAHHSPPPEEPPAPQAPPEPVPAPTTSPEPARLDRRMIVAAAAGVVAALAIAAVVYFWMRPDQLPAPLQPTPPAAQVEEDPWAGLADYDRLFVRPGSMPRPVLGVAMQAQSLSGYADVEFTVGAEGKASDIRVVSESVEDIGYAEEARRLVAAATWPTEWRGRTAPYAGRFRVIFPPGRGASVVAPLSIDSPNLTEEILALGRNVAVTLIVRVDPEGAVESAQVIDADVESAAVVREAMRVAMSARYPAAPVGYETELVVRFDVLGAAPREEPSGPAVSLSEVPFAQRPTSSDFARHYPRQALNAGVEGRVVLDCSVRRDLRLACSIAEENPPGEGFGNAALRIARRFRAERQFPDGGATVGAQVRVPMVFRVG